MVSSAFLPIGEFHALRQRTTSGHGTSADSGEPVSATPSTINERKRTRDNCEDEPASSSSSSSNANVDVVPRIGLDVFRSSCQAMMDHRTILATLITKEKTQMPDPHYMTTVQISLKPRMTSILCEWLVDVCSEECLGFSRNTLDVAIRNVERYLSKHAVSSSQFQLLGAASLLIAYKLNERHQDKMVDLLVDFGGHAYTKPELLEMERKVVVALEWNLLPVIAHEILEIMVDAERNGLASTCYTTGQELVKRRRYESIPGYLAKTTEQTWCTMQDVLYVTQSNYSFLVYPPSVQAAGAFCFAKRNQMNCEEGFSRALTFAKDLLGVDEKDVIAFTKQLEKAADDTQDKQRSATPQSVAGADGSVFD